MSEPRRYRAPRQHGGLLADPPLAAMAETLTRNQETFETTRLIVLDCPLADLRRDAVRELRRGAADYLQEAGEPVPEAAEERLLLTGHQPELFHPGVWIKNFAASRLARQHGLTAINLIVDNDALKSTSLNFPAEAAERSARPRPLPVAFDRWTGEVPFEERAVLDETMFESFPERARSAWEGWGFEPMLPAYWDDVRMHATRTPLIGERFAAARRTWERRWGCHNLELPLSRLCRGEAFSRFALHILSDLPRFHDIYNASLRDYRKIHGLRSRHHPVPELAISGEWLETPFWIWGAGASRRDRLFVRSSKDHLILRGQSDEVHCAVVQHKNSRQALADWLALEHIGIKIRCRALTTTMFARLFLADLFIHGIGGGTYDELTDEIIRRFYKTEPPTYLVLSATLLLPLSASGRSADDSRRLGRELRDLYWNPQRHLDPSRVGSHERDMISQKKLLIDEEPTMPEARKRRYDALRLLTEQLRPLMTNDGHAVEERLTACEHDLHVDAVRQRRDYSLCLYPAALLRESFEQLLL